MTGRPPSGTMVYWRFKGPTPTGYRFGYCTYAGGHDLVRMGAYNGDTMGGMVVKAFEIEWELYRS